MPGLQSMLSCCSEASGKPAVEIDLSDCEVPKLTVLSCIRGVQSCVLSAIYKQKSFFTKHTMDRVRDAVSKARNFMSLSSFNPWERICGDGQGVFVSRYMKLSNDYVALQKGDSYERLRSANKRDRKLQSAGGDSSTLSCSGRALSSVVGHPFLELREDLLLGLPIVDASIAV